MVQGPLTLDKKESLRGFKVKKWYDLAAPLPGSLWLLRENQPKKNLRGQVPGGYKSTYLPGPSPDISPRGVSNWERAGTKPKLPEGAYVLAVWTTLLLSKSPHHTQAPSPTVARHPSKTSGTKMPTCIPYCAYDTGTSCLVPTPAPCWRTTSSPLLSPSA